MSGIWGAISLNNRSISDREISSLRHSFNRCVIDRYEEKRQKTVYMGCGIQYFTEDAVNEQLPIMEQERGLYFDSDVIIDNREELYSLLNLSDSEKQEPDGTIQYKALKKLHKEALYKMVGAYAFVLYDGNKNEATIAIDAVGSRCVYYMYENETLYYSTLLESLIEVKDKVEVNPRWCSDFISLDYLSTISELEETPVEGIYRIAPAQVVTITPNGMKKESYWNPEKDWKEIKYKSDEEYKAEFRRLYRKAVLCLIRSNKNISILLSGGLDSTSVACIASEELKKQGRLLYSYTSVPDKGYKKDKSEYKIVDERDDVLMTKEYLGNLECEFIDLGGINPWDMRTQEMERLELPYKSVENVLWIDEASRRAYKNNSRIMLTGANGNTSVSYKNMELYLQLLFNHCHFIRFYKEFNAFHKNLQYSRKIAIKDITKRSLRRIIKSKHEISLFGKSYIKMDTAKKYGTDIRLKKMSNMFDDSEDSYYNDRVVVCSKLSQRQLGEFETKRSLYTGVIQRDPTRDRRVLDFCFHMPLSQFNKDGEDRRLLRCYLTDIMPEHVLKYNHLGKQSADLKYRFAKDWERIRKEWIQKYRYYEGNEFVDCIRARKELEEERTLDSLGPYDLTRHMYTISILEYMEGVASKKTEYKSMAK